MKSAKKSAKKINGGSANGAGASITMKANAKRKRKACEKKESGKMKAKEN
jgi:hypothetical protein